MNPDALKSIAIAQAVAACINAEGGVGEMGFRPATVSSNTVRIYSQACDDIYMFKPDGTVDLVNVEEAYDKFASEFKDVYTLEEFVRINTHIPFETFMSIEHGWFRGDHVEDACIAFVKAIIANE